MIKYILRPGTVKSRYDGDIHFISAPRLAALYCVPMNECIVLKEGEPLRVRGEFLELKPRYDGDYDLKNCERVTLT